eukprot:TRINITY_DN27832_c0_g1_i1.p1 TRINITY_DN27832_c0_g1~~TRINITY_DN27832_c0_g1_i1.p1  ORF type:complete len:168 (-),score=20.32 TRINITY_DN27832_c0_g1_i1:558-1061(-)
MSSCETQTEDLLSALERFTQRASAAERQRFSTVFDVQILEGENVIPDSLTESIGRWFGKPGDDSEMVALERARKQRTICVFNHWTCDNTLFNPARSSRPSTLATTPAEEQAVAEIEACRGVGNCDFCDPLNRTVQDTWGRIESMHCLTCSNVAKFAGCHGYGVVEGA